MFAGQDGHEQEYGPYSLLIEFMIFGWTMQFVMGIAFWILPRFNSEPRYGNAIWGWWSFGLLNSGILMTAAGTWLNHDLLSMAGRLGILTAVVLFVRLIYPRVKPLGGYTASQTV